MTLFETKHGRESTVKNAKSTIQPSNVLTRSEMYNKKNQNLGTVQELVIDTANGVTLYVVLSYGGFLGIGESLCAIPWNAISFDNTNKRFVLDIEVERLKMAPSFDRNTWPDMDDVNWIHKIDEYYINASQYELI